jgi:hypothetical protein
LNDIYIYPDIKDPNNEDTIKKSTSTVKQVLKKYSFICFTGNEEIGKTSLAKKIAQDIKSSGKEVILLSGNEIKNPKSIWITEKFCKKFNLKNNYLFSETVLIVDDFTKQSLRTEDFNTLLNNVCSDFNQVIVFVDKNEIVQYQAKLANKDFNFLDILPFGYVKRNEFIKKWLLIGKDDDERHVIDNELLVKVDQIASQFDTIMKKNIMDSRPIYLITIIQILDNFASTSDKFTFTSFGYCYQALITSMLTKAKVNIQQDLDGIFNFLSHLAFKLYSLESKKISSSEFSEFLKEYETKFNPLRNIKETLITSGILYTPDNDILKFSQDYLYCFCCAKFIADNFSKHSSEISFLCENIHNEEKANILIFLVHHFRDDNILLNEVLTHSICLLDKYATFDMTLKETSYYNKLVGDKIKRIIWEEKDVEQERLKSLERKDSMQNPDSILEQATISSHDEMKDVIEFREIQDIVSAIRSLEVIGQIAKNRNSSIELKDLEEILETSYDIGLRILSFYMNLFNTTFEDMRDLLEDISIQDGRINAKEEAESIIRNFCFSVCFHVIRLIAQFTAHPKLLNTSLSLAQKKDTPAYNLIHLASKLNVSYEIPKDLIREIADDNSKNILVYSLLKSIVRNHAYLYDLDYKDKQWIQSNLKIEVKEQLIASRDKSLRMINP